MLYICTNVATVDVKGLKKHLNFDQLCVLCVMCVQGGDMTQTVQLLANNQFHVIAATAEQVAQLKPRLQLVQDGQYIVRTFPIIILIGLFSRKPFVSCKYSIAVPVNEPAGFVAVIATLHVCVVIYLVSTLLQIFHRMCRR